jgi:outer membrane protein
MKRTVLTLAAVAAFGFAAKAQQQTFGFQKGDVIIEGGVSVNTTDNKATQTKTSLISLSPQAAYFINDKFAAGISIVYGGSKTDNYSGTSQTTKNNFYGAGIFGRYYFWSPCQRLKVYGQAGIGYNQSQAKYDNGTETSKGPKTTSYAIGGGVGANFFISKNIAIGYQFANIINYSTSKTEHLKATNSFELNLNSFSNFFNSGQFSLTFKL